MNVIRGALWAHDLRRLRQSEGAWAQNDLMELDRVPLELARSMDLDEIEVRDRLARGCRVFVAWPGPHGAASWLWVTDGAEYAPPLRRMLRVPEGACYGFGAGTLEGLRGRGLFTGLLEHVSRRMAEEGCDTMWCGILDQNLPSQRAFAAAGFRPVLRLAAVHEPPPGWLWTWAADYADRRLVGRASDLLGSEAGLLPEFAHPCA